MKTEVKIIEIRDYATMIPAMAIPMLITADENTSDLELDMARWLMYASSGYPIFPPYAVALMRLSDCRANNNALEWNDRTMRTAHEYVQKNFDKIKDGDVVDVRTILGETETPVVSDRFYNFETGKAEVPSGFEETF